ncbi:post-transcriptional regulator [Virgibacillus kekensis]|uniref:Post-transcriptional regulator n=1 Tax=Virgibacillus kekensis TaxID=202261 RepID=A0ABV9DJJ5_9BACI
MTSIIIRSNMGWEVTYLEVIKTVNEWKPVLRHALESKASEFQLLGYNKATPADIWKCLEQKVWKGNPPKRLYEVVQDIFHLSSSLYMSYLTVNAYQDDDLMASIAALTSGSQEEAE